MSRTILGPGKSLGKFNYLFYCTYKNSTVLGRYAHGPLLLALGQLEILFLSALQGQLFRRSPLKILSIYISHLFKKYYNN